MTPKAKTLPHYLLFTSQEINLRFRFYILMLLLVTAFTLKTYSGSAMNTCQVSYSGPDSISAQEFPGLQLTSYANVTATAAPSIQVAPNPSQGKISIIVPQELTGMTGRISILDETGKCIYSSLVNPGNPESMTIDLSANRKGKYTAVLKGNKGNFRSSFLLIH